MSNRDNDQYTFQTQLTNDNPLQFMNVDQKKVAQTPVVSTSDVVTCYFKNLILSYFLKANQLLYSIMIIKNFMD